MTNRRWPVRRALVVALFDATLAAAAYLVSFYLRVGDLIVDWPPQALWGGLALFGLSALVWLVVLSRASLSFAYPFAALTYVLILLFDRFVLEETVPPLRWGGVGFIAVGIFLISRTPHA